MTVPPANADIADLFERIADLLEIQGENVFKVNAYRRVADILKAGLDRQPTLVGVEGWSLGHCP